MGFERDDMDDEENWSSCITVDLDSGVMMFMIDLLLSLQGPF